MGESSISDITVFHSSLYPKGVSRRTVISVEMVQPLAVTMLPVMIITVVAMLQGFPVLPVLYIAFPIAVVVAFIWTWIHLKSSVCEILVSGTSVAIRSRFAAAHPIEGLEWKRLLDIQSISGGLRLTLGLEQYSIFSSEWESWTMLKQTLRIAQLGWLEEKEPGFHD